MKIDPNFSALADLVDQMGAERVNFVMDHSDIFTESDFSVQLEEGIRDFDINEIEVKEGILFYKNEQVVLYIYDCYKTVDDESEDLSRYHVSECKTIEDMKARDRYERYIATSRKTGSFKISLFRDIERSHKEEREKDLKVCINCLKALNYNGAKDKDHMQRREICDAFEIGEFFDEYSTYFKEKPKYTCDNVQINNYPDDWNIISKKKRESESWECEICGVNLQIFKNLLQTHHKNEHRFDSSPNNLEALCLICHGDKHPHMHISNEAKGLIIKERERQGLA